ncbi:MAG: hypothetical protein R3D28_21725 [Geminicoccaceae bacterium]
MKVKGKADVLLHAHVGVEGIGLEDDADIAVARLDLVDHRVVEADGPAGGRVEPGEHEERRRLAAARGPENGDELAVLDDEVGGLHGDHVAPGLGDGGELDSGH